MSLQPNLEDQRVLAETYALNDARLRARERAVEIVLGVGFAIAIAALWDAFPPGPFDLAPAAMCLLVLVIAGRVRFDTPLGYTTAVQLAFVPLLFAVPVAIVPVAVMIAAALAQLPDVISGHVRPSRLLLCVGNSWYAVGPAAVFAFAHTAPLDAGPALLLAALGAQFIVDFAIATLRYWFDRGVGFFSQLRESWIYAVDAGLSPIALVVAENIHRHPIAALAPLPLLGLLAVFAHERHHRLRSLLELNNAYHGTALVLGDVVEADDGYTGEHCRGVVTLALVLADELELGADRRRNLEFAALLHDVGKIAIPKAIINKPGRLDASEWKIIKTHTLEGQKMLERVGGFMHEVGAIVRSHHERWDGRGYPDGLAGEDIPLEARIIAICDSWNAMRTDRAYRAALGHDVAVAELMKNSGRQFDPHLIPVFLEVIEPVEPEGEDGGAGRVDLAA